MSRTHVRGGVTYVRNYNSYSIGRHHYFGYVPRYRYANWYYGWAYRSWSNPYAYRWWWASAPWCGYYGYYYRPYSYYYGPSYWLTDYILADYLAEQYAIAAANARAADDAARAALIDEEIKAQLRAQVEQNVREQEQQSPTVLNDRLTDLKHIFVVSQDLTAMPSDGSAACSLSAGDLIRLTAAPGQDDQVASVTVVTSKKGSCPAGIRVDVAISSLQEFENDFNEKLEDGMEKMKTELAGQLPSGSTQP